MTIAAENLDTIMCDWCAEPTPATAKVKYYDFQPDWVVHTYLCSTHAQEVASDFRKVNLYPLANKPEYTLLETYANPMTGEYTITELETAARYGAPYPVCGDLTTLKSPRGKARFESWTGHDPSGEQY